MSDALYLWDTRARASRLFESGGSVVKVYVCGITPYDTTHLGHAFTFVSFDVLIRYLCYRGDTVRYVQNVTDVDDPLFEKAEQLGVPWRDLAIEQTDRYLADMRALNVIPPDVFPRASQEIPQMIQIVQTLVDNGQAYVVDGHVYFSSQRAPRYGELSHLDRKEMLELARERGGDPDDPRKHDPLDFVLWRPSPVPDAKVSSPWGEGLPGWHVECSAMALKYLGAPIDIHGGGADLIFPHHECELAQSESATKIRPFARFWVHTGMVFLEGQKMSKSLGNMVFAHDLLSHYGADALRLYLSSHHYRAELEYHSTELAQAVELAQALAEAAWLPNGSMPLDLALRSYRARFAERMNEDLDTAGAIDVLRDLATAIRTSRAGDSDVSEAQLLLRELGDVLGLRLALSE
jgi:L-cysteine:1D-myo-inositol 2-amino-2-deoxy-alpha-D-glucopyranoside ligase